MVESERMMTLINRHTYEALKRQMGEQFPKLLEGYLGNGRQYLANIEANLNGDDLSALIEAAHNLKSSSGLMGAVQVHQCAETLEYAAKNIADNTAPDIHPLREHYEALRDAFSETESVLSESGG